MRIIMGAAVAALLAVPAVSQGAGPDFSAARVKAHVGFLADDLLEGRDAGTRGYDIAARYVAAQYEALGLTPAGPGGSWVQDVPLQKSTLADTRGAVTIGGKRFDNGGDVMFGPSAREASQAIEAPVVFVGFGMVDPSRGLDDYAGLDVKGKFVAILSGFPKGMPSDIGAHLAGEKAKFAQAKGAIGTLSVLTPTSLKAFPWKRRAAYADAPGYTWVGTDGKAHVEAPGIRTGASLHGPALEALFSDAPRSLKRVLAEAEKTGGRPKGFALTPMVKIERTSGKSIVHSPNVVAMLPGSDPALKDEYVLLMGHLDHDGVDPTLEGDDKIYNGAMDNAAGIATMLEVARAMATSATRPKRSILFAAVTAEEDGLLGADYLARHPVVKDGKVVAVVNLDMPVLTYDFTDVIAFGAEHSTLGPIVARAAGLDKVTLSPDPIPEQGVFTRSDHYMFVRQGVPSVFLVTGYAGAGKAANEDFEANHYHQVSDDLKVPFDWAAGAKFARINYLIAREIADAPQAPRWYEGSFFGNIFAKDQVKAPAAK
ncbi:MAG: M28 family metallopeptidase [Sphingomonadaceae bacterium]|nr:M28 family metallopeptidase [Sphingomonadaceae bacterium]